MKKEQEADIIVVGAGMNGMACALGFAQRDFRVILLESQSNPPITMPSKEDPIDQKVVAISRTSEHFFRSLGVWQTMAEARVSSYEHMTVWDAERDGIIHFDAHEFFEANLGYIIEQRVILGALGQALSRHANVEFMMGDELENIYHQDKTVIVETKHNVISAQLLVGADGAYSTVRDSVKISTVFQDYDHTAIVAMLKTTVPHNKTAFQRFNRMGPLAWLPLHDPNLCSIVWSTSHTDAAALKACSQDVFNERITRECDGRLGQLTLVSERTAFPLRTHHAKAYVALRCALIGDAAHTLHPLAGMGVNLGFLDSQALLEVVDEASCQHRDFGLASWLKRYERKRRWHNQTMIQAMGLFKRGFEITLPGISFLRNKALNKVDNTFLVKQFLMRQALVPQI